MAVLGREHVFAGVESCRSPENLPQRQLTARLLTDSEPSANGGKGRGPEVGLSSQSAEQKPMPALHKIPDTTRSEFFSAPAGRILSRVVGNPLLNAISIMLASTINFSWAI